MNQSSERSIRQIPCPTSPGAGRLSALPSCPDVLHPSVPAWAEDVPGLGQTAPCGGFPPNRDLRVRRPHSCRPCRESAIRRPRLRRRGESHGLRMCRRCLCTARSPGSRDSVRNGHRVLACSRKANVPRSPQATREGIARVSQRLVDGDLPGCDATDWCDPVGVSHSAGQWRLSLSKWALTGFIRQQALLLLRSVNKGILHLDADGRGPVQR